MYIQPNPRAFPPSTEERPAYESQIPQNYSGNAFRREEPTVTEPTAEAPSPTAEATENSGFSPPVTGVNEGEPPEAPAKEAPEAVPVGGRLHEERGRGSSPFSGEGLLGRLPFLSRLLPPPRKNGKGSILPEWLLIAAVILLFFADDGENDTLPFLLLLLLWD